MIKFKDRENASEILCKLIEKKLQKLQSNEILILCIPRGGVIVGDKISKKLGYQLNIIIPRRILAPNNKEMSVGAIMKDNTVYLNNIILKNLNITNEYIEIEKEKELQEIYRREKLLGNQVDPEQINKKHIILVDDGAATGATLIVSTRWIKKYKPQSLTIVIPICPKPVFKLLKQEADNVESIIVPSSKNFTNVEDFYQNFEQLEFNQIVKILKNI